MELSHFPPTLILSCPRKWPISSQACLYYFSALCSLALAWQGEVPQVLGFRVLFLWGSGRDKYLK